MFNINNIIVLPITHDNMGVLVKIFLELKVMFIRGRPHSIFRFMGFVMDLWDLNF